MLSRMVLAHIKKRWKHVLTSCCVAEGEGDFGRPNGVISSIAYVWRILV